MIQRPTEDLDRLAGIIRQGLNTSREELLCWLACRWWSGFSTLAEKIQNWGCELPRFPIEVSVLREY